MTVTTDSDNHDDLAAEPPTTRVQMPAGRVAGLLLTALLIAALLGAQSLQQLARRQGYGHGRDLLLEVADPLAGFSHRLWLDRPREWLASLTGHTEGPTADSFAAGAGGDTEVITIGDPNLYPSSTIKPKPVKPVRPAATTTTTLKPRPKRRVPTKGAPVKVWMGGDSLMGTTATSVTNGFGGNPLVRFNYDIQVGSGLARPDVLDWYAELAAQMKKINPDVVVLSFGGNDDQPLHPPDGSFARLGTPEWQREYARRVGAVMDLASKKAARTVVWLGLPEEQPARLNNAKNQMNAAARAEAAKRTDVIFVDLAPPLAGPGGRYTDTVKTKSGATVHARADDGVHLTAGGANLVRPLIAAAFAGAWHLQ